MKVLLALSCLLAAAAADSCDNCMTVVTAIAGRLSSEESITDQAEILVGGLCPQAPDVEQCTEGLPGFWHDIAVLMWPGYYNPAPDCGWMCKPLCDAPTDDGMTCDDCLGGIQGTIDQLLEEGTLDVIVNELATGDFCANSAIDNCPEIVDVVIRNGLPILATAGDPSLAGEFCNAAVPGTCAARKFAKLF